MRTERGTNGVLNEDCSPVSSFVVTADTHRLGYGTYTPQLRIGPKMGGAMSDEYLVFDSKGLGICRLTWEPRGR